LRSSLALWGLLGRFEAIFCRIGAIVGRLGGILGHLGGLGGLPGPSRKPSWASWTPRGALKRHQVGRPGTETRPDSTWYSSTRTSCRRGGGSGASRTRPAQGKGASRTPAAATAMLRRSAGHRTMVRRALLQRRLRAALRTRSLAQPRTPTRRSGASRTRPAQEKGASKTPAAGTAMPRRSADHRTMVRRALLCRLSVPHWPPRRPRQPCLRLRM